MTEEENKSTEEDEYAEEEPKKEEAEVALKEVEKAEATVKEMQEANKEKKDLLDREEAIMAKKALGGGSEAGSRPVKPKKLTDTEYAEALERGEVNPLKEDGFI